jgi:hypothetical protein
MMSAFCGGTVPPALLGPAANRIDCKISSLLAPTSEIALIGMILAPQATPARPVVLLSFAATVPAT